MRLYQHICDYTNQYVYVDVVMNIFSQKRFSFLGELFAQIFKKRISYFQTVFVKFTRTIFTAPSTGRTYEFFNCDLMPISRNFSHKLHNIAGSIPSTCLFSSILGNNLVSDGYIDEFLYIIFDRSAQYTQVGISR